jgi:hypothetical protein
MRKLRLRLLANAILDVRMQTMGMTDEQAMELMTKQAFQTQAEAEGKLQRAKLSSTQLPTYYVGLRAWQELRKKYEAKKGKDFDMRAYHDLGARPGGVALRRAGDDRDGAALKAGAAALLAALAAAPCGAQSGKPDLLFNKLEAAVEREDREPGRRPGRRHRGPGRRPRPAPQRRPGVPGRQLDQAGRAGRAVPPGPAGVGRRRRERPVSATPTRWTAPTWSKTARSSRD